MSEISLEISNAYFVCYDWFYRKSCFGKKTREFSIKNMALFKPINSQFLNMEYLYWFLQLEQDFMKKKVNGGVQSFVSLTFLRNYPLPLPPLAEQKRIVEKIEELLPYTNQLVKK